jgi:hypothetical protein
VRRLGLGGDFWPDDVGAALVVAAVGPIDDAAPAWRRIERAVDVDALHEGMFELLPLVASRVDALDVDDAIRPRLTGIARHTWVRNQTALACARDAGAVLHDAGIAPLIVRDLAVALHYDHLSHRPVAYVDLVVPATHADRALGALTENGWAPAAPPRRSWRRTLVRRGGAPDIRLHRGVPPELGTVPPVDDASTWWRATVDAGVDGARLQALAVHDEVLATIARGARAGSGVPLAWLADTVVLLGRHGAAFDWPAFAAGARRTRQTVTARTALHFLGELALVDIPSTVDEMLAANRVTRGERVVTALAGSGSTLLGGLPRTLADHARSVGGEGPVAAIRGLPASLAEAWQVDGGRATAVAGVRRVQRLLGRHVRQKEAPGR